MNYLSVCSGIEAATMAWHGLGWNPVAFSEIERFPSAVLAHHYPDVPNWGDMNDFKKWPDADVDVLVGGTPCQSFSVAGLRKGMADPRGNLALIYLAIAERYRPTWLVWENVPGVLSSDGGRDFGAIIGGMVELGYCPTWRVLDAQYVRTQQHPFAVPQRRRRVFVVAHLGDWRHSAEVLLEPESLLRNPAPSREARERIASSFVYRPDCGGGNSEGQRLIPEVSNPLTHRMHKGINTTCDEGQTPIPEMHSIPVAFAQNQREEVRAMDVAGALASQPGMKQQTYVAQSYGIPGNWIGRRPENGGNAVQPMDNVSPNLTSTDKHGVATNMAVRRLTPLECERLQGFPDRFTDIPGASDSARYKALGNSMAVNVMRWIGERINAVGGNYDG